MKNIILIGAGGHCKVIIDAISRGKKFRIAGIIDTKDKIGEKVLSIPVIGTDADLAAIYKKGVKNCFISVGSVGDSSLRQKLYRKASEIGFAFPNIISKNSIVSKHASMGCGNFIAPGAIVNAGSVIGNNCIINTGAIVEHDCVIGDFAHIAPGAILSGGDKIGNFAHIGNGASVKQYTTIGSNSIIGTGCIVTKNIGSNTTYYNRLTEVRKENE